MDRPVPAIQVVTDHPVHACLASQYAGWAISEGKYFAMGSGPMRAAHGKEELFDHIPGREQAPVAVGCQGDFAAGCAVEVSHPYVQDAVVRGDPCQPPAVG